MANREKERGRPLGDVKDYMLGMGNRIDPATENPGPDSIDTMFKERIRRSHSAEMDRQDLLKAAEFNAEIAKRRADEAASLEAVRQIKHGAEPKEQPLATSLVSNAMDSMKEIAHMERAAKADMQQELDKTRGSYFDIVKEANQSKNEMLMQRIDDKISHIEQLERVREEAGKKNSQPPENPLDVMEKYLTNMEKYEDFKRRTTPPPPEPPPSQGMDPHIALEIKKLEMNNLLAIEKMRLSHDATQTQLSRQHDLAVADMKLKIKQFESDMMFKQLKEQQSGQSWANFWKGIGDAVKNGAIDSQNASFHRDNGARTMSQGGGPAVTQGGLNVINCENEGCGFPIPVDPRVIQSGGAFFCPQCGAEYGGTNNGANADNEATANNVSDEPPEAEEWEGIPWSQQAYR